MCVPFGCSVKASSCNRGNISHHRYCIVSSSRKEGDRLIRYRYVVQIFKRCVCFRPLSDSTTYLGTDFWHVLLLLRSGPLEERNDNDALLCIPLVPKETVLGNCWNSHFFSFNIFFILVTTLCKQQSFPCYNRLICLIYLVISSIWL